MTGSLPDLGIWGFSNALQDWRLFFVLFSRNTILAISKISCSNSNDSVLYLAYILLSKVAKYFRQNAEFSSFPNSSQHRASNMPLYWKSAASSWWWRTSHTGRSGETGFTASRVFSGKVVQAIANVKVHPRIFLRALSMDETFQSHHCESL